MLWRPRSHAHSLVSLRLAFEPCCLILLDLSDFLLIVSVAVAHDQGAPRWWLRVLWCWPCITLWWLILPMPISMSRRWCHSRTDVENDSWLSDLQRLDLRMQPIWIWIAPSIQKWRSRLFTVLSEFFRRLLKQVDVVDSLHACSVELIDVHRLEELLAMGLFWHVESLVAFFLSTSVNSSAYKRNVLISNGFEIMQVLTCA